MGKEEKNKLKPDGPGQIRDLIVCPSRRTCANRSGSLAGCKSIRIFLATRLTFRSVPYCKPVYCCPSTPFFWPLSLLYSFLFLFFLFWPPNTVPSSSHTTTTTFLTALTLPQLFSPPSPSQLGSLSYPDYPQQVPFVKTTRQLPGITFPHTPTITSPLPHTCH